MMKAISVLVVAITAPASAASSLDSRLAVTPVQKVIQILGNMLEKGKKEKHEEEIAFAAFRQWCQDTVTEKEQSVAVAAEQIDHLNADIQMAQTESEELTLKVNQLDGDVATWQGDIKAATNVREIERATYLEEHKDYTGSIDAIGRAVEVLKQQAYNRPQAEAGAFLERVSALAKVPMKTKRVIDAFLEEEQEPFQPPEASGYEFKSHGVVDMLEKLQDKFGEERSNLEREEMNKKHSFEVLRQDLESSVKNAEESKTSKSQRRAKALQSEADMKSDLDDTTTTRADDSKYLRDTSSTCTQKEKDFADRQQLRADEIVAIEKAVEILSSDSVSGSADKHLPSLVQRSSSSLAQLRSSGSSDRSPNQERVASFLRQQGDRIGSHVLSALSVRVEQDPFGKVKTMIRDLINKLMEEASEEAEHKGWCDTELAENEQVRTTRTSAVETLRSEIDELEASIAKTAEEITALTTQVADNDKAVASQTSLRQEEKAKNEATVKDSQEAQTAVSRALTVLQEFYEKAGEATALVQKKQARQPETFDEPFTGQGAQSGGVLGMLEVVQSDFARLESETSANEATAQADYERFMTESALDKTAKTKDIEHKQSKRGREEQELVETQNDLTSTQKELDAAVKYFDQLKPSCLDQGTSFEEREARRKEEIQSLQEALRILNGEDLGFIQDQ